MALDFVQSVPSSPSRKRTSILTAVLAGEVSVGVNSRTIEGRLGTPAESQQVTSTPAENQRATSREDSSLKRRSSCASLVSALSSMGMVPDIDDDEDDDNDDIAVPEQVQNASSLARRASSILRNPVPRPKPTTHGAPTEAAMLPRASSRDRLDEEIARQRFGISYPHKLHPLGSWGPVAQGSTVSSELLRSNWIEHRQEKRQLWHMLDDLDNKNAGHAFADRARSLSLHGPPQAPRHRPWHQLNEQATRQSMWREEWRSTADMRRAAAGATVPVRLPTNSIGVHYYS